MRAGIGPSLRDRQPNELIGRALLGAVGCALLVLLVLLGVLVWAAIAGHNRHALALPAALVVLSVGILGAALPATRRPADELASAQSVPDGPD